MTRSSRDGRGARSADAEQQAMRGLPPEPPGSGAGQQDWDGWEQQDVLGRGARHDRVDRGETRAPKRGERISADYVDAGDVDFGGRDSAEYYARHGSNQARQTARREYQARRHVPDDRGRSQELDRNYHLAPGPRDGDRHYRPAPRRGISRRSDQPYQTPGGLVEPSHGSSPTRQATDHRGRGPRNIRRPDERIRDDLCQRLTEDPVVDASDIVVDCHDGNVTLQGAVETRWMKHRAEDIVDACPGVAGIDNRLAVRARNAPRLGPNWP